MRKFKDQAKRAVLYMCALVLVSVYPTAVAFAEAPTPVPETYTYDPVTQHWNSNKWVYDPVTGVYVPAPEPKPVPAKVVVNEDPVKTSITQPGPDSNNEVDTSVKNSGDTSIDSKVQVNNDLDSDSKSGDAGVIKNTKAGGASTGNADANTTTMNVVHSTVVGETEGVAYFTADINGNVTGDITLSPANGSNSSTKSSVDNKTKTDIKMNSELNNDIDVNAKSGNATVESNGEAGDAESGDANAVVNLINLINSIIAANQSFVGTINIYGNLDGDILISPEFIPQLLASNRDDVNLADPLTGDFSTNLKDDQSIVNNVKLNAKSGSASVDGNTEAGGAFTGNAQTNLTILNLTGRKVIAKNALLVFINVLGEWIGVIVDAPSGSTAAAIGNGVISNETEINNSSELNAETSESITNNVNVNAESGNTSVKQNTKGGSAKSGNATASANILNISNSTFNVSDWFGVLFINVFGKWHGSFGVNTANGQVSPLGGMAVSNTPPPSAPNIALGFTPSSDSNTKVSTFAVQNANTGGGTTTNAVLSSSVRNVPQSAVIAARTSSNVLGSIIMMIAGFIIAASVVIFRAIQRRRQIPIAMINAPGV